MTISSFKSKWKERWPQEETGYVPATTQCFNYRVSNNLIRNDSLYSVAIDYARILSTNGRPFESRDVRVRSVRGFIGEARSDLVRVHFWKPGLVRRPLKRMFRASINASPALEERQGIVPFASSAETGIVLVAPRFANSSVRGFWHWALTGWTIFSFVHFRYCVRRVLRVSARRLFLGMRVYSTNL